MSSSSNGGKKPATGGGRGGPTIRTLADINRGPAGFPGPGGSGSDSDEPQEYYTGGEKRGRSNTTDLHDFSIDDFLAEEEIINDVVDEATKILKHSIEAL